MNSSTSFPLPEDATTPAFQNYAEAQASATVRALIARAAKPAQAELEALRVALDVRCESLTATLAGAGNIDPEPIRELVERLTSAANEEASAAARAARTVALEEAEARLQIDRAEAQRQLDVMRAEAAAQRDSDRIERSALTDAIQKAMQQADALRADRDLQLESLRLAQVQADSVRADRDAQLEALRAAREHADAIQADRDAQAESLRLAQVQADAVRADRDAQLDALRVAREHADAIQADRDAQAESLRLAKESADIQFAALHAAEARSETLRVERDAQVEALRVAAELTESMRAERDAQLKAALEAKEEARTILSEQDALLEASRISHVRHARILEMAQSQVDAAHTQLAAAQAEAERRIAVGIREIEALRDELERVRAEMERARAEAARPSPFVQAAEPAVAFQTEPVIEHFVHVAPEPQVEAPFVFQQPVAEHAFEERAFELIEAPVAEYVAQPAADMHAAQPIEHDNTYPTYPTFHPVDTYTLQYEAQAEPATVMAPPSPEPLPDPVGLDPVLAIYQAISSAADLSQVLDALVDGVGTLFPRAALFVVKSKSKRLQGWRSVGFTGGAAITREFELPLTTDSALTRAVTANRTIFTGDGPSAAQAEAWTVTFPVTTGGRVVAVVHADGGDRNGIAVTFDREAALNLGHTLVRMAGERIAALTMSARAAFGNVVTGAPVNDAPMNTAPAGPAPVNGFHATGTHANGATILQHVPAAPAMLDDAGRYASQLVSEINRYGQAAAPAGQNLQEQLAGQIEGARTQSAAPAPSAPASALGLFDEALGKMLGNGATEASIVVQPV